MRELLTDKAKGSAPKDVLRSQPLLPLPLPPPPPPPPPFNSFTPANLKKRKKVAEEGELVLQKEGIPPKQQKIAKGQGKDSSIESKKD